MPISDLQAVKWIGTVISLDAKTALITGSSRGIGRGIALKLAERGVERVAVHYLKNKAAAEDTALQVRDRGAEALVLQADVTKVADIQGLLGHVKAQFGSLDILVCNARPDVEHFYQPVEDVSLENWQCAQDSQARALLITVREAAKFMPNGARVIAITYAPGGRTGSWEPWAAMGPAKAAMESLCRYFAWRLAKRAITVNAVSPGATDDSVFNSLPAEVLEAIKAHAEAGWVPMGRLTTPADVGDAVVMLCTSQGGFITGQTLHVDGGAGLALSDFPLALQTGS